MKEPIRLSHPDDGARIVEIQKRICQDHRIPMNALLGFRRHKTLVRIRHDAMRRAYHQTGASTTMIGRAFNRDHTTVLYAVGRLKTRQRRDPNLIPAAGERRP